MKLKFIISSILFALALSSSAQVVTNEGILVFPFKKGDPRVKERSLGVGFEVFADEIEAWREKPSDILAGLGEDLDWAEDVKKANASGGHVVVAEIVPGESAELCMTPADASKVTHLKLTGRAMKWGAYGPTDLKLDVFLRKLKNLKVLNLRDLDCEIIYLDRFNNVEKIVLPANCTSARVTGNKNLQNLVFGPKFEAFGYVIYDTNKKYYQTDMTNSFIDLGAMKTFNFPEGVAYIGGFTFGKATQSVTFPSTLKLIEYFGDTFTMSPYAHMQIPALKEIHVNALTPPRIKEFPFEYEHLKNVTLYVPRGTKDVYMKDLKWRNFGAIVEEDVVIAERPVDEDMTIVKPITSESVLGKWKFEKHEIKDLEGKYDRPGQDPGLDCIELDGKYWIDYKKDGTTNKMSYYFIEGAIYLGTQIFHIEKADDKELILFAKQKIEGIDFRFIFTFSRAE